MMTTITRTWMTVQEMIAIDWEGEAIAAVKARDGTWFVTRRTKDGAYAVIRAKGRLVSLCFVNADVWRCRSYAMACAN